MSITYRIDAAFNQSPIATTPTWTDITSYWRWDLGFRTRRGGRPDEFSGPQPGTLGDLVLDNSTGAFTFGNPASPFYPGVVKDVRIRVTAIVAGVEYIRWDGHVDDWALSYDGGTVTNSLVTVSATSRMRLVSTRGALRSFLAEEYLFDSPLLYLPFSDDSAATVLENIAPNPYANGVFRNIGGGGSFTLGQGTGPPADGSSALVLTPASSVSGYFVEAMMPYFTLGSPYGFTIEAWINSTTASSVVVDVLSGSKAAVFNLFFDASKHIQSIADFGGLSAVSSTVVANGATRHVAATLAANGTNHVLRLYVDGVQVNSATLANTSLGFGVDRVRVGGDGTNFLINGTISHVAAYPTALSATRILAHYQAGWTGFGGERSDQRVARIATYVGLASSIAASRTGVGIFDDATFGLFDSTLIFGGSDTSLLELGSATVYGQNTGGQDAPTMLNDVATTENGVIVMTRDGALTMQSRSHRYNRAPSFSIDYDLIEPDLRFSTDTPYQANLFTATTQDGVSQTARNQASITGDTGVPRADSAPALLTRDPLDAYSKASWVVNRYGSPRPRTPAMSLDLGTLDDAFATRIFPADLGDSFLLTGTSPAWAPVSAAGYFIEDYEETVAPGRHVITWTTSNASTSQVGVFDDPRYGQFDTTLVFAF